MQLHPLYKRNFRKILAFGIIWLVFALIYVLLEFGIIGRLTEYPSTGNKYSFFNSLIVASIGGFLMGLTQGTIEILWFRKFFTRRPFWMKILIKSLFYLLMVISFLIALTIVNNAYLHQTSIYDPLVHDGLFAFMGNISFWIIVLYIGIVLDIALFYSEIKEYLGKNVIFNYLGKYHQPKQERRIFMFLDMKSSTAIAESLGHEVYFELLKTYYADMTKPILETSGEVYQYVGDEIVITWKAKEGLLNNNCMHCYRKIYRTINRKQKKYMERFGLVPEFKAGYHIGMVTAGEIGIIKKDIIYTGDVLNTSARIQEECNSLDVKTLISSELYKELQTEDGFSCTKTEKLLLRGKKEPIYLYAVNYN